MILMRDFVPEEQQRTDALHLLLTMGAFFSTPFTIRQNSYEFDFIG